MKNKIYIHFSIDDVFKSLIDVTDKKIPLKKFSNAKMENLIGNQIKPYRDNIKLNNNQFFYDYLKKEVKEKRKMGHITTLI